ncbi:hypothetical protein [Novosphingobium guangzhouense]|uniref:hypothetical protein n=1 Tax=Novosphingobium guangzhouense TaxID=1850347 RepID=UPI0011AF1215|nr:hypothetical protein [Novosphingobium guangzhouense]
MISAAILLAASPISDLDAASIESGNAWFSCVDLSSRQLSHLPEEPLSLAIGALEYCRTKERIFLVDLIKFSQGRGEERAASVAAAHSYLEGAKAEAKQRSVGTILHLRHPEAYAALTALEREIDAPK